MSAHLHGSPSAPNNSMTDHPIGAAGALKAIATVLSLEHGLILPTVNYRTANREWDLDWFPKQAPRRSSAPAMSNDFAVEGTSATLEVPKAPAESMACPFTMAAGSRGCPRHKS